MNRQPLQDGSAEAAEAADSPAKPAGDPKLKSKSSTYTDHTPTCARTRALPTVLAHLHINARVSCLSATRAHALSHPSFCQACYHSGSFSWSRFICVAESTPTRLTPSSVPCALASVDAHPAWAVPTPCARVCSCRACVCVCVYTCVHAPRHGINHPFLFPFRLADAKYKTPASAAVMDHFWGLASLDPNERIVVSVSVPTCPLVHCFALCRLFASLCVASLLRSVPCIAVCVTCPRVLCVALCSCVHCDLVP